MLMGIFLISVALFMLIKPDLVWEICESWKSDWTGDPSPLYIFSIRFGGTICIVLGILSIIINIIN